MGLVPPRKALVALGRPPPGEAVGVGEGEGVKGFDAEVHRFGSYVQD